MKESKKETTKEELKEDSGLGFGTEFLFACVGIFLVALSIVLVDKFVIEKRAEQKVEEKAEERTGGRLNLERPKNPGPIPDLSRVRD